MMRKTKSLLIVGLLWTGLCTAQAQIVNEDEYEITVTNEEGKEETIELPEGMTAEQDSLFSLYFSKNYLEKDPSCQESSVNPAYEQEVYIDRLRKLPTIMEMPYNDVVRKFIDRYAEKGRSRVSYMLGLSNFYMPIFEQALEAYELPLELKYLPVIESGLNPRAVSSVGATGLWQFMVTTAKRYGLQVNSLVDERQDPIRSSYAAAQYLRDLYRIFGDWNLVIAAYNCGPENINHAIRRAGGAKDYWKIYPYLPSETRGYVPAFIAANYIMNYYCEHNICPMLTDLSMKTDTVEVNRDVHLQQIATVCGVDLGMLRELNPQYRRDIVNGSSEPSVIRMPIADINTFIEREDSIYAYQADILLSKRSQVDIPEQEMAAAGRNYARQGNSGRGSNSYSGSSSRSGKWKSSKNSRRNDRDSDRKSRKKSRRSRKSSESVTIRNGETLSEIAAKHGTTVKKLKKLNKINGSTIRAGKKIKVK